MSATPETTAPWSVRRHGIVWSVTASTHGRACGECFAAAVLAVDLAELDYATTGTATRHGGHAATVHAD